MVGIADRVVSRYDTIRQGRIAIRIAIYWAIASVIFRLPKLMLCFCFGIIFRKCQSSNIIFVAYWYIGHSQQWCLDCKIKCYGFLLRLFLQVTCRVMTPRVWPILSSLRYTSLHYCTCSIQLISHLFSRQVFAFSVQRTSIYLIFLSCFSLRQSQPFCRKSEHKGTQNTRQLQQAI